jgi:hypothetical protein
MATRVNNPVPPNLPLGPEQYERRYQDQYSNVLRLYFNQLKNSYGLVLGDRGGQYLQFPYAAIQRNTDLTFSLNTPTQITFEQNDYLSGCTNDGTDGIHVQQAGIYNYQFSAQFANTNAGVQTAYIWLRVNGVDLDGTGSKFDVPSKHAGSDGYLIAACNFYVRLNAGDFVELYAAVANTSVYLEAYPAQTSPFAMPSIPSVVATLSFVSALPA